MPIATETARSGPESAPARPVSPVSEVMSEDVSVGDWRPGENLAKLLVDAGLVDQQQLRHAKRVRDKLDEDYPLSRVLTELRYLDPVKFRDALREQGHRIGLGEVMVELGYLRPRDFRAALDARAKDARAKDARATDARATDAQADSGDEAQSLSGILLAKGLVSEQRLIEVLADQLGFSLEAPSFSSIDPTLLEQVTPPWCRRLSAIPVRREANGVLVLFADPLDAAARDQAEAKFDPLGVIPAFATRRAIDHLLREFESHRGGAAKSGEGAAQSDIANRVEALVLGALEAGASKIHIEPADQVARARFRIEGGLALFRELAPDEAAAMANWLRALAKIGSSEGPGGGSESLPGTRADAQGEAKSGNNADANPDASVKASLEAGNKAGMGAGMGTGMSAGIGTGIRAGIRADIKEGTFQFKDPRTGERRAALLSFCPTLFGDKVVIHLPARHVERRDFAACGIAPKMRERFNDHALGLPGGVILIAGPGGSGKTTTLYTCIDRLKGVGTSVSTLEDPVEALIPGVAQSALGQTGHGVFVRGLSALVRQDPDVLVVGEVRDRIAAEAAMQAALGGQKVIATFNAEDSASALPRLIGMDVKPFLIASTVVGVLAQRLVRKVCAHCTERHQPAPSDLKRVGWTQAELAGGDFRLGRGCPRCNFTGYSGRIGVFELLLLNDGIREAIVNRAFSSKIRAIGVQSAGLVTLLEDGLAKAGQGQTSLAEVAARLPRAGRPRAYQDILALVGERDSVTAAP